MKRFHHPALVITLLACFVFVSGALSAQAAKHSAHHAHHKATTHASSICSWMCAAGQVIQSVDFELREPNRTLTEFEATILSSIDRILIQSSHSRAPPV